VAATLAVAAPASAQATVERHPVYAGADAFFGDCPFEPGPPGTSCTETRVGFFQGDYLVGGGSLSRAHAPWQGFVEMYRYDFNGTVEPTITVWVPNPARQHYGNDGPLIGFQHYVDRCLTFVSQAPSDLHPRGHDGHVERRAGALVPRRGVAAGIFNNNYTFITVPHHGCE
jgi:hypothetical protein